MHPETMGPSLASLRPRVMWSPLYETFPTYLTEGSTWASPCYSQQHVFPI